MKRIACWGAAAALVTAFGFSAPALALSTKECSTKYQAAKGDGSLNGRSWPDYRKAECGPTATPAAATAPAPGPTPAATTTAQRGTGTYPAAIDPKYAAESAGKGRMHTCLDAYKAAKAGGTLGDAKWISRGGGYYSACNAHLKGA